MMGYINPDEVNLTIHKAIKRLLPDPDTFVSVDDLIIYPIAIGYNVTCTYIYNDDFYIPNQT